MRMTISIIAAILCLQGSAVAAAPEVAPGHYRVSEGPDVAGQLEIATDGTFRYFLAAGALDEQAQGRWERREAEICLFTEPRPTPPQFSRDTASREDRTATEDGAEDENPFLVVAWPDGNGIPLVDFVIGLEDGEVLQGYTQYYGWEWDEEETRKPLWVELSLEIYGVQPQRFDLDGPHEGPWRFILNPNDFGVVDFEGACLRREGKEYVLTRSEGEMHFVRSRG
jgi:hypothetical protein